METKSEAKPPKQKRSQQYPEPLVYEATEQHRQSFIILHGRGSNANTFGPVLLETRLPNGQTFRDALPHVKFVFPTASFRRATTFKRIPITQWFDLLSIDDPCERQDLQVDGLNESTRFVHGLIRQEAEKVGFSNVVLGGLSQGCATMLMSLLLWNGPSIRAAFGMSGWLPFQNVLARSSSTDMDEDDIFEKADESGDDDNRREKGVQEPRSQYGRAIECLRNELDLPAEDSIDPLKIPIFLGHGVEDEKVVVQLGEQAAAVLKELECRVSWHSYEGLGHWYSDNMLADIITFLEESAVSG